MNTNEHELKYAIEYWKPQMPSVRLESFPEAVAKLRREATMDISQTRECLVDPAQITRLKEGVSKFTANPCLC